VLLLFGMTVRYATLGSGGFHCPRCDADRTYHRRQARRWFTLFLLPVVPMKVLGELVECATCGARYDDQVLRLPTTGERRATLAAGVRAGMAAILGADGEPDPDALAAAVAELHEMGWSDVTAAGLHAEARDVDPDTVGPLLLAVAPGVNELGRELLLRRFCRVALARGSITPAGNRWLGHIGAHLGMTPAHVRGVIAEVLEQTP